MCRVIQAQLPRSESSARQAARLVRATGEEWVPDLEPAVAEAAEQMTRAVPAPRVGSRGWGQGLTLVDTLSDEWGSTPLRVGKQVWFTVAVGAASQRDACVCGADAPGAVRLGSGASVVSAALAPEPS